MPQVNTVLGPIDPAEMGFTLSHEHVTLGAAGAAATYPGFQDRQAIADGATAALSEAYAGGVRTIIDVTTFDLGRDVAMMQEVSRRTGVHVIPCTGNHLAVPRIFWGAPVDRVAGVVHQGNRAGHRGYRGQGGHSQGRQRPGRRDRQRGDCPAGGGPRLQRHGDAHQHSYLVARTGLARSRCGFSRKRALTSTWSTWATATTTPTLVI